MKISTVIFDWAGTTVDFGCFAPVDAFMQAFMAHGITPTAEEIRAPMGIAKRAHVAKMLATPRLAAAWERLDGRPYTEADIDAIYGKFEPSLFAVLDQYAQPIPGVSETVAWLRGRGIKIGSTTGYTQAMMDVVAPLAKQNGYAPDCLVTPDAVGGKGRPFPYMLWRNLEQLGTVHIGAAIKIGDTEADMEEASMAGCLAVGVLAGSSMMGLSEADYHALPPGELDVAYASARAKYVAAGADFVIESITELPKLLLAIG